MILSLIAAAVLGTTQCKVCGFTHTTASVLTRRQLDRAIDDAARRRKIGLKSEDRDAIQEIVYRESRRNRLARNSRGSTAYGLAQFLNSTWKGTGVRKTSCPSCQIEAMLAYIRTRYRSPPKALQNHRRRGFY